MIKIIISDTSSLTPTELTSLKNFFNDLLVFKQITNSEFIKNACSEARDANPELKVETMFTDEELNTVLTSQKPQWQPSPAELFNNQELDTSEEIIKTNTVETVELDSAGQPWDEKIHTNNKSKNKDGTWRIRRNSTKERSQETVETPSKPDLPPPPPAAPLVDLGVTFTSLMIKVQEAISAGKLTIADVARVANSLGLANISEANKNSNISLLPKIDELLTGIINSHG